MTKIIARRISEMDLGRVGSCVNEELIRTFGTGDWPGGKIGIVETFLLVLAALFLVIDPPGTALVFPSMTKYAAANTRRLLARRIALNAFFVMAGSLLAGAFILRAAVSREDRRSDGLSVRTAAA